MEKTLLYPVHRDFDGVYYRVKRNGQFEDLCFTDLTVAEQNEFLATLDTEGLKRMVHLMADSLRTLGDHLDLNMEVKNE